MAKVLIFGGRDFSDWEMFKFQVNYYLRYMDKRTIEIVSGGCDDTKNGVITYTRPDGKEICGADGMAERYARENGYKLTVIEADWKKHGKPAGPIRNSQLAEYVKGWNAIGFWDEISRGTGDMKKKAENKCTSVIIIKYSPINTIKK